MVSAHVLGDMARVSRWWCQRCGLVAARCACDDRAVPIVEGDAATHAEELFRLAAEQGASLLDLYAAGTDRVCPLTLRSGTHVWCGLVGMALDVLADGATPAGRVALMQARAELRADMREWTRVHTEQMRLDALRMRGESSNDNGRE